MGFVQSGLTDGIDITHLVSLGSLFPQALMVYYRDREPVEILSQLRGKRLAIGPEGSGTRALALKLLKANDMDGPPTMLLDLAGQCRLGDPQPQRCLRDSPLLGNGDEGSQLPKIHGFQSLCPFGLKV